MAAFECAACEAFTHTKIFIALAVIMAGVMFYLMIHDMLREKKLK